MVKEEKTQEVEELRKSLEEYPVIGLIDVFKLPSKQLQQIKKKIRETVEIRFNKKSIIIHAFHGLKKEKIGEFEKAIPQQPAVLLTRLNPFEFYSMISKLKSTTFAKEGDIAPSEIKVSAGPTNLLPGPAISELTKVGIPAGVEEGKIVVKKDAVVAKKGDKISKQLAAALRKLNIEPVEVGLNVVAIYENGDIFTRDILELVNIYPDKIKEAFNQALNLSINISYPTKENIGYLLVKAYQTAKGLENKFGGAK